MNPELTVPHFHHHHHHHIVIITLALVILLHKNKTILHTSLLVVENVSLSGFMGFFLTFIFFTIINSKNTQ